MTLMFAGSWRGNSSSKAPQEKCVPDAVLQRHQASLKYREKGLPISGKRKGRSWGINHIHDVFGTTQPSERPEPSHFKMTARGVKYIKK